MESFLKKLPVETRRNLALNNARSALQFQQQDYSPWQRNAKQLSSGRSAASPSYKTDTESRPLSVATIHSNCSSKCRHSWNGNSVVPPISAEDVKKKHKRLSALKMQIRMKELSLCEYKKCYEQIFAQNKKMKEEIAESENQTHAEATSLLQRYERFRGSIGSLQKQYQHQSTASLAEYEATKKRILKEVNEVQRQSDQLDKAVVTKNNEVKTLLNYKEKEYPDKIQTIAKLKRQRERLRLAHQTELEELLTAINEDISTNRSKEELLNNNVRHLFTEEAIGSMNEQVKTVALQNMIVKKEIEIHKKEVKVLKDDICNLQKKVRALEEEKQNGNESLPPISSSQATTKCLPEDDILLDFPIQTWLPI